MRAKAEAEAPVRGARCEMPARGVRGARACKRRAFSPMWVPMTVEAAMASASDHRNARCVSLKPRATIAGQTRKVQAEV